LKRYLLPKGEILRGLRKPLDALLRPKVRIYGYQAKDPRKISPYPQTVMPDERNRPKPTNIHPKVI
jgi:hypothetical protein